MDLKSGNSGSELMNEVGKSTNDMKDFDPDKRLNESSEQLDSSKQEILDAYDPDKKIEVVQDSEQTGAENFTETASKVHRYVECHNQGLEGDEHPVTGVRFERRIVDDGTGELVEGVFPVFKAEFETKIPKELYKAGNNVQFKKANEHLWEKINTTTELKNKFDEEQLAQIEDGETPDGYVWHHNEEAGVLQLVDFDTHAQTGHTGGRSIWGGGY